MLKIPNIHTTPPGRFRYKQPETGATFEFGTWNEILDHVYRHRKAMGIADLTVEWDSRLQHSACEQNPHWGCEDDAIPPSVETPIAVLGRELWGLLHSFAETYADSPTEEDKSNARYWMSHWRERIPRFGGCACREDWARLEASYPPDYSSRENFIKWASNGHDWVNRRIGKPIFHPEWFDVSPVREL